MDDFLLRKNGHFTCAIRSKDNPDSLFVSLHLQELVSINPTTGSHTVLDGVPVPGIQFSLKMMNFAFKVMNFGRRLGWPPHSQPRLGAILWMLSRVDFPLVFLHISLWFCQSVISLWSALDFFP